MMILKLNVTLGAIVINYYLTYIHKPDHAGCRSNKQ